MFKEKIQNLSSAIVLFTSLCVGNVPATCKTHMREECAELLFF